MKTLSLFLLCLGGVGILTAKDPDPAWATQKGITDGQRVKGSESPDGRYALFEFFNWDGGTREMANTASGIGLAPVDRSQLLFVIESRTKWSTDKEVPLFLTFLWNDQSSLLATHDAEDKHSRLNLYRIAEGKAISLDVPDLLAAACKKAGVARVSVTASGQLPVKWLAADRLAVKVRLHSGGKNLAEEIALSIDAEGKVSLP